MLRVTIVLGLILSLGCSKKESRPTGQCKKDTDCKGERICEAGECLNPEQSKSLALPTNRPLRYLNPSHAIKGQRLLRYLEFPKSPPSIPQLNPGNLFKNFGLNLKFKLGHGKNAVDLRFKGMKNNLPVIEVCKAGKCEVLDSNNPASFKNIFTMLMGQGTSDPMAKMFLDLLQRLGQGGSGIPMPTLPVPRGPSPFSKPRPNKRTAPYRSWAAIQRDGQSARGTEAILGGLTPVQVTGNSVVFKDSKGNRVEARVPATLKTTLPSLAKTSKKVIARIELTAISSKSISGTLKELEIPK